MRLVLENVKKEYKDTLLFQNIQLRVPSGEMVALQGRSGVGKSTLLNLVAGLEKPTSGEIQVNGISLSGKSMNELSSIRGKEIGYIAQNSPMIPKLTALENAKVPLWLVKQKSDEEAAAMQRLFHFGDLLGVAHLFEKRIEKLSGGEAQRIGILRALVRNPGLIVADEPTSALDDESVEQVIACFHHIRSQGVTIIVATHSAQIATRCDKRYRITQSELVSVP
ncbi:ABC transporter ATP-binding protein [Paenibacillus sp. GCM10012307]|uniref:ATP-binding cassette domain-containing protein n=1 Tax=Paenibacillus roseus TaxID=2798579 RepID=A0A934J370_9BACL|nr:ATP-binding cassette domain-containing protein [Paenibacillus roseus]MBJ6361950.1 ATP-binding cassette domain-containing protein [Paenibacillus roseus]